MRRKDTPQEKKKKMLKGCIKRNNIPQMPEQYLLAEKVSVRCSPLNEVYTRQYVDPRESWPIIYHIYLLIHMISSDRIAKLL